MCSWSLGIRVVEHPDKVELGHENKGSRPMSEDTAAMDYTAAEATEELGVDMREFHRTSVETMPLQQVAGEGNVQGL